MEVERYVGERRALRHFLQELRPLVVAALGEDAVLRYRIDRGLQSGDLAALRQAREIFHNQPEDLKRRLMRGIFETPAARPSKSHLLERYTEREPEPFVRFEAYPAANSAGRRPVGRSRPRAVRRRPGPGAGQPRHPAGQRGRGAPPDRRLDRARSPAALGAPLAGRDGGAGGAGRSPRRRRRPRIARATVRTRPDRPGPIEPFSAMRPAVARGGLPAGLLTALLLLGCAQGPPRPGTPG